MNVCLGGWVDLLVDGLKDTRAKEWISELMYNYVDLFIYIYGWKYVMNDSYVI